MAQNLEPIAIASQTWLEYLDKNQYDKSWEMASDLMKLKISQKDWTQILNKLRKPLGSVSSRQLLEQRLAKDPKGLPAGDYAVMFYKTAFSTKPLAYELLTLFLENGQWKILTYQVN